MKKTYLLFIAFVCVFGLQAQYIYTDFDENQNETFAGWPNAPTLVANPDMTGINTSANVGEWVRTAEMWAHTSCELDGFIDFSEGSVFQVKVHSPITCSVLLKLENSSGAFTEISADVTAANEWFQLTYDFSGAESGIYNKIVIFFDFMATTDNTFYFDDVEGPGYESGSGGDQIDLPVTFEDPDVVYGLTDFGGNASEIIVDPNDESNHVAKTIKTTGSETWAGTTVGGSAGFANPVPFTEEFTKMSVDIWSPTAGTPMRLKVEDSGDSNVSVETETLSTVAEDWETVIFDFSNEAPGTAALDLTKTYNKASIFFNFDTPGADETYYWDNMIFIDPTGIINNEIISTRVYPNPATDVVYIENAENLESVSIYSVQGQLIYQSKESVHSINVSDFPKGMYTMRSSGIDGKQYFAKFIVK